ncbi:MAG: M23 family metallopeptidase [Candidatus Liberibacter ctenarytainae]|uniref:M23 family metallopeptidase n=1 Tax=Candidatus Liberibacter ctenarytainae TaxID=2020335 RepID=A0A937DLA4_9HYPH|nr:M23 family metallopeptidase [Candidatus Liberibacter ctenarytainae]
MALHSTLNKRDILSSFGDDQPILGDGDKFLADRLKVSLQWLSSTFLAGITLGILMGGTLLTALDGRQKVAIPAKPYNQAQDLKPTNLNAKLSSIRRMRSYLLTKNSKIPEKIIIDVPTLIKEQSKDIIKKIPFIYAKIKFSTPYPNVKDYPKFDLLKILSGSKIESSSQMLMDTINNIDSLYGTESELEIINKKSIFPLNISGIKIDKTATDNEIKQAIINQTSLFSKEKNQSFTLYYSDSQPLRKERNTTVVHNTTVRILEENRSITETQLLENESPEFADDLIPIRHNTTIVEALTNAGYAESETSKIASALKGKLPSNTLTKNEFIRVAILQKDDKSTVIRVSIYRDKKHLLTIALNDHDQFVLGIEPAKIDIDDYLVNTMRASEDFPSIYDGVWRSASFHGMDTNLIQLVIRLLVNKVDLQAQLKPTDFLETFFSVNPIDGKINNDSELLYLHARFGENRVLFYRFQNPHDGSIKYFNENGNSSQPFLLRSPVPHGRVTSGFGMRRHPILNYTRMHTGVDWAAPRGTPIIAVSDGIVEKSGWAGGYGKQTIIRHSNGYTSSYNHQDEMVKNIKPGMHVKQGQIIGWIGTTGIVTGPHLHYELIVNGIKVDSMKIRIPERESLKGDLLHRFNMEVKRINSLINNGEESKKISIY